jgi:LuxR family maltose regulon positive regulatory protein
MRPEDAVPPNREDDYLLHAHVLVATGEAAPVLGLLERVRATAEAQGRIFNVIAPLALRALALRALGQTDHALADLALALAHGEGEGFVRAFADYGAPMAALLAELRAAPRRVRKASVAPRSAPTDAYIDTVLAACAPLSTPPSPTPLPEPLSGRELEVLRLIAAGYSNSEIAGELVVALSTIKTHLHHIYAKLGVQSRTQALARARDRRLLPAEDTARVKPPR